MMPKPIDSPRARADGYALTYWADHPVKEVKVVRFEKADRR